MESAELFSLPQRSGGPQFYIYVGLKGWLTGTPGKYAQDVRHALIIDSRGAAEQIAKERGLEILLG